MEQWFTGRFPFELPGLTVVAYCYSTSARSIWLDTLLSVLNLVRIILVATQTRNANLVHFFDHGRTLSYRARTSAHNQACELLVLSHGKMRFRMVRVWQIIGLIAKKLCSGKLDWYYSLWPQQLFSARASKQSLTWFMAISYFSRKLAMTRAVPTVWYLHWKPSICLFAWQKAATLHSNKNLSRWTVLGLT